MKNKNTIRIIRAALGMTRAQMAAELEIDARTIYNYEHGITSPSLVIWGRIRRLAPDIVSKMEDEWT